jgi:trehalose-6-phosphatase
MDLDIQKLRQKAYCFDYDGITDFYADEPVEEAKDGDLSWLDDLKKQEAVA